jgi:RNA polymerase-interacting CarD/CdnL/TRCF family regulator
MEFRSGDHIVHTDYGVGSIVRLEDRQIAENQTRLYYVLVFGRTTVWSPVQAGGAAPLRLVTDAHDLDHYRSLLKGRPTPLDRDYKKRRLDINEQLAHGSFQVVCEVVRDLTALGWHRRMNDIDTSILKRVRTNLWEEWATSTGQSLPEAIVEVSALLQVGEQTYQHDASEQP